MRSTGLFVSVCALAALSGCGGGGGSSTGPSVVVTPTPVPTPTPPAVLLGTNFTLQNGFSAIFRTLNVSGSGTLDITLDWTLSTNDLDIDLVRGTCTAEMFQADTCNYIGFADSTTAKPEKLRMNVTAGQYTVIVDNYGPGDESGSIQVVFTAGATAAAVPSESLASKRLRKPRLRLNQ